MPGILFASNLRGLDKLDNVKYIKEEDITNQLYFYHTYKIKKGPGPCYLNDMFKDIAIVYNFDTIKENTYSMLIVLKVLR